MFVLHHAATPVVIDAARITGVVTNAVGFTEISLVAQTSVVVRESASTVKKMVREYQAKQLAALRACERQEKEMVGADCESTDTVEQEAVA